MPWYRNGHSVPVVYKGRLSGLWWVDHSWDGEQASFRDWREAIEFALTTIHPHPSEPESS